MYSLGKVSGMNPLKLSAKMYVCVNVWVFREEVHSFHQLIGKVCGPSNVQIGLLILKSRKFCLNYLFQLKLVRLFQVCAFLVLCCSYYMRCFLPRSLSLPPQKVSQSLPCVKLVNSIDSEANILNLNVVSTTYCLYDLALVLRSAKQNSFTSYSEG